MKIYNGPLDRKKLSYNARVAYESFNAQKQKCRNPNNRWFKNYGAKGIDVHYGPREFIAWWLNNLKTFKGKTATVSRINHDKGYYFDNIKMEDVSDNSRESCFRNNLPMIGAKHSKKVCVYDNSSLQLKSEYPSIRECARSLGVSQRLIQFNVRKLNKKISSLDLIVRYEGDHI